MRSKDIHIIYVIISTYYVFLVTVIGHLIFGFWENFYGSRKDAVRMKIRHLRYNSYILAMIERTYEVNSLYLTDFRKRNEKKKTLG